MMAAAAEGQQEQRQFVIRSFEKNRKIFDDLAKILEFEFGWQRSKIGLREVERRGCQ